MLQGTTDKYLTNLSCWEVKEAWIICLWKRTRVEQDFDLLSGKDSAADCW